MENPHALVSLNRLFLWWSFPRQHDPAPRERHFGSTVPEPICFSTREGFVVCDRECLVGDVQPGGCLRAVGPGWSIQYAANDSCGRYGDLEHCFSP